MNDDLHLGFVAATQRLETARILISQTQSFARIEIHSGNKAKAKLLSTLNKLEDARVEALSALRMAEREEQKCNLK